MQEKKSAKFQNAKRVHVPDAVSSNHTVKQFSRLQGKRFETAGCRRSSRRQRRLELEQDIEKLKKKLKYEENVHRALERAFTRPLGALPRLPPYLSPKTLELLAEVAVLEEEVVRLEEQIVLLRQGLYHEALCISSSKRQLDSVENVDQSAANKPEIPSPRGHNKRDFGTGNLLPTVREHSLDVVSQASGINGRKVIPVSGYETVNSASVTETMESKNSPTKRSTVDNIKQSKASQKNACSFDIDHGKENQLYGVTKTLNSVSRVSKPRITPKKLPYSAEGKGTRTQSSLKAQAEHDHATCNGTPDCVQSLASLEDLKTMDANRLSEETVKCLLHIFLKLKKQNFISERKAALTSSLSLLTGDLDTKGASSRGGDVQNIDDSRDPYGVSLNSDPRDVGPYKYLHNIRASSIDMTQIQNSSCLLKRLRCLIEKLSTVDLRGMNHQQKLAFWINVYNACMMNAFIEQGIPINHHMMIAFMRKAVINVGGRLLNALAIEHFILRLPYHFKDAYPKNGKRDTETTIRSVYGLEWPEPLVTFALACGSRSSPAVRVYTAANVMMELETAKREYLQAAIGVLPRKKLLIPKLLDWYAWDFAKDSESFVNWICAQLPGSLQNLVTECVELGKKGSVSQVIEVMPYEFDFRYLLAEECCKPVVPS
eukprot:TRINITY_DN460_c0_g1_i1.p1 TRINITY_DN460_c0_g1~~TRINITY_DN460_c0_g1_i1.p1  ORF type:complete len:657 (-),score=114.41 TRINITY_DN460_c0_g1_i1:373-2343(-)